MEQGHIVKSFDKDLRQIEDLIKHMAELADKQISRASKAVRGKDEEVAKKVVNKDVRMNQLDHDVILAVTRILALRQPKAQDLRATVAVIKVASHLERIGDYAKNIAWRSTETSSFPALDACEKSIRRIVKQVRHMLSQAMEAYKSSDVELAYRVISLDDDLDAMYNSFLRELLTYILEETKHITASMHLLFIARNLERIGDHVAEIAGLVVYIETGLLDLDDESLNPFREEGREEGEDPVDR